MIFLAYNTRLVSFESDIGVRLDGVVFEPAKKKGALIFVHGGGGNFYSGIVGSLSSIMAERGYLCLCFNTRYHDDLQIDMIFEEEMKDIGAAVGFAEKLGYSKSVLIGHSLGVVRIVCYQALSHDPRVKGLVLQAGPINTMESLKHRIGPKEYERLLELSRNMIKKDPHHVLICGGKKVEPLSLHARAIEVMTVRSFMSLRAPETKANALENIGKCQVPILIIHGTKDTNIPPEWSMRMKKASRRSKLIYIDGAGHYFRGFEEEVADRLEEWLRTVIT